MDAPVTSLVGPDGTTALVLVRKKRSFVRAAAPVAVAVLGAAASLVWRISPLLLARRRQAIRRRRTASLLGGAVGLAVIGLARWQLQRLFTEEPTYAIEKRVGPLEIRSYSAVQVAETTVDGTWEDALNRGFLRLARFIFGGNERDQHMAMTAPVLGTGDADGFRVAFILPRGTTPPAPTDARVALREVPPRRLAVLRFNGGHDARNIEAQKRELTHVLAENGLKPLGEASFAGYDPPSTLPSLRRNELWVELADEPAAAIGV